MAKRRARYLVFLILEEAPARRAERVWRDRLEGLAIAVTGSAGAAEGRGQGGGTAIQYWFWPSGNPPELPKMMRSRASPRWSLGNRPEDLGFWKLQGRPGGSAASAQIDPVVPAPRDESDKPDRSHARTRRQAGSQPPLMPWWERARHDGNKPRIWWSWPKSMHLDILCVSCCCVVVWPSLIFR